jgi:DHA2 family lincomycin resistance protein-like MFS transporter
MLVPIMMNTVLEIYPPEKRGAALGICMMAVVAAPGVGPAISGLTLQYLNWHWLFIILLPFSFLAMFLGMATLKDVTMLTYPKIDIPSIILSTLGFGGLIFGICSIETKGFYNITVLISLLCGIGGLALFSIRQFALKEPLLELRVFQYRSFTLGVIIIFIAFMMPISISIILPTFMQNGLGISPAIAGFAVLPGSILNAVIAPISGRLCDKIGGKPLAITGFSILTIAMFILSHVSPSVTLGVLIALHIFIFVGVSLIFTPIQTASLNQLPNEFNPHGVAILNTAQQISAAFGSSLFVGLMGAVQEKHLANMINPDALKQCDALTHGVNAAFTASLIMVLIGLIVSFFLNRKTD